MHGTKRKVRFEVAQQNVKQMEQRHIVGVLPAKVDDSMTEACRDDGA